MCFPLPPLSKFGHLSSSGGYGDASRDFIIGGLTDELRPFTKSSEIGLGYTTDSTALLSGMHQAVFWCMLSSTQLYV